MKKTQLKTHMFAMDQVKAAWEKFRIVKYIGSQAVLDFVFIVMEDFIDIRKKFSIFAMTNAKAEMMI